MAARKIVLHGPALDNAGRYCDAGSELVVGAETGAGIITAARAKELLDRGTAVTATAAAAEEKAAAAAAEETSSPASDGK